MVIRDSIVVCACLSIAAHAAVAIGAVGLGGPRVGGHVRMAVSPAQAQPMRVRIAAPPSVSVRNGSADADSALRQAAAIAPAPAPLSTRPSKPVMTGSSARREAPPSPATDAPAAVASRPADALPSAPSQATEALAQAVEPPAAAADGRPGADDYVPRRFLTQPPVAHGAVMLPYPADGPANGRFVAVLALYIDEAGVVRRVRADGDGLPPSFEAAAEAAFLATRFEPGAVDGRIVKSLIRVEVTFESTPGDGSAVPKGGTGGNPG